LAIESFMINDSSSDDREAADLGPHRLRRMRFRTRSLMLAVAIAALCASVFANSEIGPVVAIFFGLFGVALTVMGAAMALGLLGFGFMAAAHWVAGRFRRASRWPDE
jgi:hypothetical protein